MDFDDAIAVHSRWKRSLRRDLTRRDCSLNPAEISLDHKCGLGEWIYGEALTYSSFPEYLKLKYEHARFHMAASEVVRKANAGDDVAQEIKPCSNSEFSRASSAIVIAIMALKRRAAEHCEEVER